MSSVSFVVPVFNKAKYLKTVIKSLRLQTGNFDKEYIFVNDGANQFWKTNEITSTSIAMYSTTSYTITSNKTIKFGLMVDAVNATLNTEISVYEMFISSNNIFSDSEKKLKYLSYRHPNQSKQHPIAFRLQVS